MKKLLLLFFVLLVFPLAQAMTVTHTGSFTAGDSLNITINMASAGYTGNLFWNTTSSNNLTWSKVNGSGTFSAAGENYTFHANDSGVFTLGTNIKDNNFSYVFIAIISSVIIYFFNDLSSVLGKTEKLPIELSVWMPILIIFIFSTVGVIHANQK